MFYGLCFGPGSSYVVLDDGVSGWRRALSSGRERTRPRAGEDRADFSAVRHEARVAGRELFAGKEPKSFEFCAPRRDEANDRGLSVSDIRRGFVSRRLKLVLMPLTHPAEEKEVIRAATDLGPKR